jgi:Flp pilus assembly CpaF family ATPase
VSLTTFATRLSRGEQELAGALRAQVGARLAASTNEETTGVQAREVGRALIKSALEEHARAALRAGGQVLDLQTEAGIERAVFDGLFGLGGFQQYLDDPEVENIIANGCDRVFIRYAGGRREQVGPVAASDEDLVELLRTIAARAGAEERRFDRAHPQLNIQLGDGSRLFAVMSVCARPSVTIRRHRLMDVTLADLVALEAFDRDIAEQLAALVRAKFNVLIAGGMDTGKTTLLRAMASCIDPLERLVTIEDTFELGLHEDEARHPDVVPLQAREANLEGFGQITQAELVRMGLRMSADRVIVGEVRGAEVIPMLNAMSQGSDGSLGTIHASNSQLVFNRLASYAIQAPERLDRAAANLMVASSVHVIVQLAKTREERRVITSIREITGINERDAVVSNEVYKPGPDRRAVPGSGWQAETAEALIDAGLDEDVLARAARAGWSL